MTDESSMPFPPTTRAQALERLAAFVPRAGRYAAQRNHVEPGHGNVSRLSPATRTRLLLETEICRAARKRFAPSTISKFEQEVWWRLYWKGWLELRPAVWASYRDAVIALEWSDRARRVAAGESGVAIMDLFARELIDTGYMHNHARMWWAAFWIHVERLPWQLGADFFLRHLHDGDAASNTLSWRWVAGLHTRGKNYLVRRSNVERYVHPDLLDSAREGTEALDGTTALKLAFEDPPPPRMLPEPEPLDPESSNDRSWGLWIHDEDLLLEKGPLARYRPAAIATFHPTGIWQAHGYSSAKREFLRLVLDDGTGRASEHFGVEGVRHEAEDLPGAIAAWARESRLDTVVASRPFVGPLDDQLEAIEEALEEEGVGLVLIRRPTDVAAMNNATAGFFGFWKKTESLREAAIASLDGTGSQA